jgi:hypothetical protein
MGKYPLEDDRIPSNWAISPIRYRFHMELQVGLARIPDTGLNRLLLVLSAAVLVLVIEKGVASRIRFSSVWELLAC